MILFPDIRRCRHLIWTDLSRDDFTKKYLHPTVSECCEPHEGLIFQVRRMLGKFFKIFSFVPIVVLLFIIILALPYSAEAKYRRKCTIKYRQQYGWSKKYTVDVTFLTGQELNEATSSYNYKPYNVYAVIFWDRGQATVIRLKNILLCGSEVTYDCVEGTIAPLEGYDQDDDLWNICIGNMCF